MKNLTSIRSAYRMLLPEVTILIASLGAVVAKAQSQDLPPQPPAAVIPPPIEEYADAGDVDVLTRGPLHEAFAAPVAHDPEAGEVIPQAPPEPIDELPPDVKPEGRNVEWIPGYWAWDDAENRHIWISGVWRDVPPGREWVPGYWTQDGGGHRWVSGYWGAAPPPGTQVAQDVYDAAQDALDYVAPPPESLEAGPTSPQPSDQHFWIPGCWIAGDVGYRWRPGYWYGYVPNWVWVPDQYAWTPAGCIFVPGYWDYTLAARGMCFAPVYFNHAIYTRPHYFYRPYFALDIANVALHLFVHPNYRSYCYGDYYGANFASFGYLPWFQFGLHFGHGYHHRYYDPLLSYYGTHFHRHGIGYVDRLRGWHHYYDRHQDRRPPHTFADQRRIVSRGDFDGDRRHVVLARSIDDVRRGGPDGSRRVVAIDRTDREVSERQRQRIQAAREVSRARRAAEATDEIAARNGRGGDPNRRRVVVPGGNVARERIESPSQQASREQLRAARERARQLARADEPADNREPGRRRVVVPGDATRRSEPGRVATGEELRRSIERARQSARNSQDAAASRRRVIAGENPQIAPRRPGEIVRGQSPSRGETARQDARARERVPRLGTPDAQAARDRARQRPGELNSRPSDRIQTRPPTSVERNQSALDEVRRAQGAQNAQRARDAARARQAQDAARARQAQDGARSRQAQDAARARQRSVEIPRSAAQNAPDRARSQARELRGGRISPAPVQRDVRPPAAPRQFQRPAAPAQRQRSPQIAPRQIERRQAPSQGAARDIRRSSPAQQRPAAARSQARSPQVRSAAPRPRAQARPSAPAGRSKPTTVRPGPKAKLAQPKK